jgi:hypothetical protein
MKQQLGGGHLWSRGYYVGTSGDKVTNEIIMRYIRYQRDEERPLKSRWICFNQEAPALERGRLHSFFCR